MYEARYENHLKQTVHLNRFEKNQSFALMSHKGGREYTYSYENGVLSTRPKKWTETFVFSPPEKADEIIKIFEVDATANKSGKLFFNGVFYIRCKCIGVPKIIFENDRFVKLSVDFVSDDGIWSKETTLIAFPNASAQGFGTTYPHTYPFTYGGLASFSSFDIHNGTLLPADFKVRFDGAGSAFSMTVGANKYEVSNAIAKNESFFLDTQEKSVYKTTSKGNVDLFPASSDTDYIFEQIPPGGHTVFWNAKSMLFFTLIEHYRIPPWS